MYCGGAGSPALQHLLVCSSWSSASTTLLPAAMGQAALCIAPWFEQVLLPKYDRNCCLHAGLVGAGTFALAGSYTLPGSLTSDKFMRTASAVALRYVLPLLPALTMPSPPGAMLRELDLTHGGNTATVLRSPAGTICTPLGGSAASGFDGTAAGAAAGWGAGAAGGCTAAASCFTSGLEPHTPMGPCVQAAVQFKVSRSCL
jgi:hypothetical protein